MISEVARHDNDVARGGRELGGMALSSGHSPGDAREMERVDRGVSGGAAVNGLVGRGKNGSHSQSERNWGKDMVIEHDIAIVGGGLVGASLAAALAPTGRRVILIEAAPPPVGEPSWDERCIALNDASQRIFTQLGVWGMMRAQAEPIRATHISERGRFGTARFAAHDAGLEALGYNVPLRAIGTELWRMLADVNVELVCPGRVEQIHLAPDKVTLDVAVEGEGLRQISAKLVVAADGASSAVRRLLGIKAHTRDYAQHAIVSAVKLSRPHIGVAYERFLPSGPIALIPKPGGAASLVWSVPSDRVEALMKLSDEDYRKAAQDHFGGRAGRFTALGRRWTYPLARVMSRETTAPRVALIGNAAQSLHPVAAQGFNLGLRDVAGLAEALAEARDPGDPQVLAAYAACRARDRESASGITDLMVRVFSNRIPCLTQLRHWGLVAVDMMPGLRESVMRQHLGHTGLPRAAV